MSRSHVDVSVAIGNGVACQAPIIEDGFLKKIAGDLAKSIHRDKSRRVVDLETVRRSKQAAAEAVQSINALDDLVAKGDYRDHAEYAYAQNVLSVVLEALVAYPALRRHVSVVGDAEDVYLPGAPPMSPVTTSFFTSWQMFDVAIGLDKETLIGCVLDLHSLLPYPAALVPLFQEFAGSRMGIYEHLGQEDDGAVVLRELNSEKSLCVRSSNHYSGSAGQLWYVRLLPALHPGKIDAITFTTPYILTSGKVSWLDFLANGAWRQDKKRLSYENFMKRGLSHNYWNEFVFQSYAGVLPDLTAILLAGVPDQGTSRPCFSKTGSAVLPERARAGVDH